MRGCYSASSSRVLIGGLLSGVLYSLVALGFVLIFKASGVFNFAQGAMVLLAGLALVRSLDFLVRARRADLGGDRCSALLFAGVIMAITAWLIERFVLGPLVNQDGLTLFMSTIGVTFIIEGAAQMIFGSDVYPLRLFPTDAWFLFENTFPGRHPGQQARRLGRPDRRRAGGGARHLLPEHQDRPRAARRRRRSRRGAVGRHPDQLDLVRGLAGGGPRRAGGRDRVGHQARRAVLHHLPGAEGAAGADHRRLHVGAGRHRRRAASSAPARSSPRSISARIIGGGIEYWFAYVLALVVLLVRPQGLFGERIIERI